MTQQLIDLPGNRWEPEEAPRFYKAFGDVLAERGEHAHIWESRVDQVVKRVRLTSPSDSTWIPMSKFHCVPRFLLNAELEHVLIPAALNAATSGHYQRTILLQHAEAIREVLTTTSDWSKLIREALIGTSDWSNALDAIESWEDAEADWDGDNGVPPTDSSLAAARAFVDLASQAGAPEGEPYIANDGEIGFQWTNDGEVAAVSFLADGSFLAFCPSVPGDVRIVGSAESMPPLNPLWAALREFA